MITLEKTSTFRSSSSPKYSSIVAKGPMLDRVYSLRYRSYSSECYIDECSSKKFMDEYDSAPNCTSFLTYKNSKILGSIRSCVYSPITQLPIPLMDVFLPELEESIGLDDVMIEANKFVVDPSFQRSGGIKARFCIYKNIADEIIANKAKYLVAGVRTEHIKFYKMLKFDVASEIKSYPHLNFKTVLLVCRDVEGFCEKIYSKTETKEIDNGSLFSYSAS